MSARRIVRHPQQVSNARLRRKVLVRSNAALGLSSGQTQERRPTNSDLGLDDFCHLCMWYHSGIARFDHPPLKDPQCDCCYE